MPRRFSATLAAAAPAVAALTAAAAALAITPSAALAQNWRWPVAGEVIQPYRNGDDPYASGQHRGIDIAAASGSPVVAAAGGTVRFTGVAGSSGLTVSVRTADGSFDTSYLHLASVEVRKGAAVAAGDRLGSVGTSGRRSSEAPHLHFGVREAGTRHAYRDPLDFLPPLPGPPPPQPDPPPGAPAPLPAPVRPEPVPAPDQIPAGRRVPAGRRIPAGRRVPAGRRIPAGRRVPVGLRVPAARRSPARHRTPAGGGVPAGHGPPVGEAAAHGPRPADGSPAPAADRSPRGTLTLEGPGRPPEATPNGGPARPALPRDRAEPGRGVPAGPDMGWALACLGLLLAAACIGTGAGDTRAASRRAGARLAALLRPLAGRR